jgi:signal peptidase I
MTTNPEFAPGSNEIRSGEPETQHSPTEDYSFAGEDVSTKAEPEPSPTESLRRGGFFREVLETALIAIVIFFAVRALVLNFRVDGNSMMPNLQNGEMLLVNRNAYSSFDLNALVDWIPGVELAEARDISPFSDPHRGDVIVFEPPVTSSKPYIKRIVGLPGETIEIRDGSVYIDGERLGEPYVQEGTTDCGQRNCGPLVVPEGHVYVLGDNRRNSSDSRVFGPVAIDSILGKAWVTYWPINEFGRLDS